MEWVTTTGKTLPEAIDLALDNLGVDESEAEIVVLEEPSKGLFGRVRGTARVEARVKPKAIRPKTERGRNRRGRSDNRKGGDRSRRGRSNDRGGSSSNNGEKSGGRGRGGQGGQGSRGGSKGSQRSNRSDSNRSDSNRGDSSRNDDVTSTDAAKTSAEASSSKAESKGRAQGRSGSGPDSGSGNGSSSRRRRRGSRSGSGTGDAGNRTPKNDNKSDNNKEETPVEEVAEHLRSFLGGLTEAFGLEGGVDIDTSETDVMVATVEGQHGLMVGPKGRTLDAIQELARVSSQRAAPSNIRIRIDVGGYRKQRAAALGEFARRAADKAVDNACEVALEPMSPADRKSVHDALVEDDRVETRSVGTEPRRKVVVIPVEDAAGSGSDDSDSGEEE